MKETRALIGHESGSYNARRRGDIFDDSSHEWAVLKRKRTPGKKSNRERSMKILLATDGSRYAQFAARFLNRLNLSSRDEIIVFHALHWLPFQHDEKFFFETLKEINEEAASRILDSMKDVLKDVEARVTVSMMECAPDEGIIEAASASNADLIVMGARGLKGIESFFLGSVASSVSAKSSGSVLVVKIQHKPDKSAVKILFAADGSDCSLSTQKLLSEIPFGDNTELTVLNVCSENFDIPVELLPGLDTQMFEIMKIEKAARIASSEKIVDEARYYFRKRLKNISVRTTFGDPSTEILEAAEELKADVIVLGCRGIKGTENVMGSVSRNVLAHSKCSVLIGKA